MPAGAGQQELHPACPGAHRPLGSAWTANGNLRNGRDRYDRNRTHPHHRRSGTGHRDHPVPALRPLPRGEKTAGCHRPAGSGAAGGGHGLFGHLLPEGRFVHRLLWSARAALFGLRGGGSPLETEYGAELGGWHGAAYGFGAVLLCVIKLFSAPWHLIDKKPDIKSGFLPNY